MSEMLSLRVLAADDERLARVCDQPLCTSAFWRHRGSRSVRIRAADLKSEGKRNEQG